MKVTVKYAEINGNRAAGQKSAVESMNPKSMTWQIQNLKKINAKLQLSYRKTEFLRSKLRRLLSNSLIQPHFDYACISWYPLVNKRIRKKMQVTWNKCIHFCLKLNSRHHIGAKEFKGVYWEENKRGHPFTLGTSLQHLLGTPEKSC